MNDILELARELEHLRKRCEEKKAELEPLQAQRDIVQGELMEAMRISKLKAVKTDTSNYSLVTRHDVRIVDERRLIESMPAHLRDECVRPRVDTAIFKATALSMLKNTGEVLDGSEAIETQFISIRANDRT